MGQTRIDRLAKLSKTVIDEWMSVPICFGRTRMHMEMYG